MEPAVPGLAADLGGCAPKRGGAEVRGRAGVAFPAGPFCHGRGRRRAALGSTKISRRSSQGKVKFTIKKPAKVESKFLARSTPKFFLKKFLSTAAKRAIYLTAIDLWIKPDFPALFVIRNSP